MQGRLRSWGLHPHESGTRPRDNEEQERGFGPPHAGLRGQPRPVGHLFGKVVRQGALGRRAQGRSVAPSPEAALKWGLVVFAIGGGLFVDLLALSFESPVAYAVLLMGAGVALLGYYLIEQDEPDRANGVYTPSDAPTPESVGEPEL
ncbi:hypothetical protein [Salinibacter altiplanensis]|uniref:hypothetical protein n=1 Tax=Salinibacter altiplanensis TaxID=1803181 RepID=UPI000C9F9BF7|nr:hypothetical protein [Salinibacter altiplanensis]